MEPKAPRKKPVKATGAVTAPEPKPQPTPTPQEPAVAFPGIVRVDH